MPDPVTIMSAAARTGKTVLDVAKDVLAAINAVRQAARAAEELEGDLKHIRDCMELVQSKVNPHGLPSTSQGIKALEQLQETLEEVAKKLDALSKTAATYSAGQGRGMCESSVPASKLGDRHFTAPTMIQWCNTHSVIRVR